MKKKIAVFTTGWCGEILSQFLSGMMGALNGENADVFLFIGYPTYIDSEIIKQGEMNIFNLPDLHDFAGAVLFGSGLDFPERKQKIIDRCNEAGIPIIMQGSRQEGVGYVGSDNYQATKDMCEHLSVEHGVRKIIFLAGTKDSYDSELRLSAVRDYLKENNREEDLVGVYYTNWEIAAVSRYMNELVSKGNPLPDAFICANDGLAMETCLSLSNHGFNVPEDAIVTGYDYIDDSKVFDPCIASVDQCFTEMGEAAVGLLNEISEGADRSSSKVISCKFIPGDSCGCYEIRNSDKLRRRVGCESIRNKAKTTYFNRKLDVIDTTVLSCYSYQDFKEKFTSLLKENHSYEGDNFHVLVEPNFSLSMYDTDVKLNTDKYSKKMEVFYSTWDGEYYPEDTMDTRDLIPGYKDDGVNHLYVFLPLHEAGAAYGYIVFRDCIDSIPNRFLLNYKNRLSLVFEKFSHAVTLNQMNKRLLDIMRRDPLTKVSNRMAYEDKEKLLQSQINSAEDVKFAITMFDVNNLKLINDTEGHEAGDEYLIRSCHLICNVFKHSPVFRMGGDEFVAVLSGEDYDMRDELLAKFNEQLSPYSDTMPLPPDYVSVACGMSVYDPQTDSTVTEVNKRADDEMYRDKAAKKEKKE